MPARRRTKGMSGRIRQGLGLLGAGLDAFDECHSTASRTAKVIGTAAKAGLRELPEVLDTADVALGAAGSDLVGAMDRFVRRAKDIVDDE